MILDIVWMITAGEVQERFQEFDGCKGENLRRRSDRMGVRKSVL